MKLKKSLDLEISCIFGGKYSLHLNLCNIVKQSSKNIF